MKRYYLLYLLAILSLASCYSPRYLYSPPSAFLPQVNKQGDADVVALYSSNIAGDKSNNLNNKTVKKYAHGYDLQATYALTDKFLVLAGTGNRRERNHGNTIFNDLDSMTITYKREFVTLGGGYYTKIKSYNQLNFHLLGGIDFYKNSFTDVGRKQGDPWSRFMNYRCTKVWVQPGIVQFTPARQLSSGLVSRFGLLRFHNIKSNYSAEEEEVFILKDADKHSYLFWEPNVNFTWQPLKQQPIRINFLAGCSFMMTKKFIDHRSFLGSIGLSYHPQLRKAAQKKNDQKTD